MTRFGHLALLSAALLSGGCFLTQNPSYFPYLRPTGKVVRSHAKPHGEGYFANFDPYAHRLELRPLESSSPVRTQYVLIATIYDDKDQPRRGRRVEWLLEGVGNIIEVDESGWLPGRGSKIDNKYAVSYTAHKEHLITRGNADPSDDFMIRPGQTYCVISSAVEGDTQVTAYAPEIHNWDQQKVTVTKHWIDAVWALPPATVARSGTEQPLSVTLRRMSDNRPLAGYRVRFRLLDGPPAVLRQRESTTPLASLGAPTGTPQSVIETTVPSDLAGLATVTIAQVQPSVGVNRVLVEVIRPPDPTAPGGTGIVIGRGEAAVQWQAPLLELSLNGPERVPVGQPAAYTITVGNTGTVESAPLTIRHAPPDGMTLERAEPPAREENGQLVWELAALPPGERTFLKATFKPSRVGTLASRVQAVATDGTRAEDRRETLVTTSRLKVAQQMTPTAVVGTRVVSQITVSNTGNGEARDVVLTAQFDEGLRHESGANPVELPIGTIPAGETASFTLELQAEKAGRLVNRVDISENGQSADRADAVVEVKESALTIEPAGPVTRYVGKEATFQFTVGNTGDVPLANVVLRDRLPTELTFRSAGELGQWIGGEVVWPIGPLSPGERKTVRLTVLCERLSPRAVQWLRATGDPAATQSAEVPLEILGVPGLKLELYDSENIVPVGDRITYTLKVHNIGTLPASGVVVSAEVPAELKPLAGQGGTEPAQIAGQRVQFAAVDGLMPGQTLVYTIEAEALKEGDVRLKATLKSAVLGAPLTEEEGTRVVPRLGPTGAGR